ncbi:MAG: hypothetical protein VXY93_13745, partial [Pseudomonadota bacterium]|nr:hypothetical protein [Pseudomonadota bacterium]
NLSDGSRLTFGSNQRVDAFANNLAFFWRQYTSANDNPFNMQSDFTRIFGSPTSSHNTRQIAAFEWAEGCSLYYTGTKRLQTSGVGVTITSQLDTTNIVASGVVTATTFKGALQGTSGTFSSGVDITGDLDVDGHTDLDNVSVAGVVTATTFVGNGDFFDLDVDGHTNLDNVSIAGVTTFSDNIVANGHASISGRLTSHSARFEDDGTSDNPVVSVMADDHNPYAFVIGNSTYNTSLLTGHSFFVMNDGDAYYDIKSGSSTDYNDVFFRLRLSNGTTKNCITFEK